MERRIRATTDAPSQARKMIGDLARDLGHRLDDVSLILSELVTNSVVHGDAAGEIDFSLSVGDSIRLEVTDMGDGFDDVRAAAARDNGLGLVLVDRLSKDWGVTRDGDRFTVWVELPRP